MSRMIAALIVAAVAVAALQPLSVPVEAQSAASLNLTVRNVTTDQPITPPIAVVHDSGVSLLPQNPDSLDGLEELAEAGAQSALAASLGEIDGVKGVFSLDPPPIPPGQEVTASITASPGDHVSVIAMLACTNDAITIGTLVVSESGQAMSSGRVYDAGTEDNTETSNTIPCLGGDSAGVSGADSPDGEGRIAHHQGIVGGADLTKEQHGWDNVAMQLFLSDNDDVPAMVEFGLTIDNLTLGQPITPPLAVVHDPNVDVLVYGSPDELEGIADLAEGGARDALAATLRTRPGVVAVKSLATIGPIPAGTSLIADATGGPGRTRIGSWDVCMYKRRLHPGDRAAYRHGRTSARGGHGRCGHRLGVREQRRDGSHGALPRRGPRRVLAWTRRGFEVGPCGHYRRGRSGYPAARLDSRGHREGEHP